MPRKKQTPKKPVKKPVKKTRKKPAKSTKKRVTKKVENAFLISQYYGFDAINIPKVTKEDKEVGERIKKGNKFIHEQLPPVEEGVAMLRENKEHFQKEFYQPLMFYCEGQAVGSHKKRKLKPREKLLNLHIVGTPKSIAEAILIKTALCILEEEGFKNISLEINNIGDDESLNNFLKELTDYYRKNLNNLNATCRQLLKDGSHTLVACGDKINNEIKEEAPSSLNFLSEPNKNHFKEVLEFLDKEEISYNVSKDIVGDPNYSTNTIFTILDKKSGKILATGSRYNNLARKSGMRKDIPAIGLSISLNKTKKVAGTRLPDQKKARFYFMQIGFDAKLKSLQVVDALRKAKIPFHMALSRDKLSNQLEGAKRLRVPYILMMGQKEAMNDTIVIRDTKTHSQEAIPIKDLIPHLRKLK